MVKYLGKRGVRKNMLKPKAYGGTESTQLAVGTSTRYRHMFTPPGERCAALDASLVEAAAKIRDSFTDKDVEPCAIGTATQTPARCN